MEELFTEYASKNCDFSHLVQNFDQAVKQNLLAALRRPCSASVASAVRALCGHTAALLSRLTTLSCTPGRPEEPWRK